MGQYDIPMKYRTVMRALKKIGGIEVKHASNHETATIVSTGHKTTIPRHPELNKLVVGSIIGLLLANGYSEETVRKAFKIKK